MMNLSDLQKQSLADTNMGNVGNTTLIPFGLVKLTTIEIRLKIHHINKHWFVLQKNI